VHEITEKIVSQRRVGILAELSSRAMEAKTAEQACMVVAEVLGAHPKDIPFALLYLLDGKNRKARLAGAAGVSPGSLSMLSSGVALAPWGREERTDATCGCAIRLPSEWSQS